MAKKLTEMALIKKLDRMNHEEMKKIIVDLYKFNKSVEEGICLQLLGEDYGSALLEKYKKRIHKIFNPTMLTSQTLPTQCHLTYKKSMALGYKLLAL